MKMENTERPGWGMCTNIILSLHDYNALFTYRSLVKEGDMAPALQEPLTNGLVRLYMGTVQEGMAVCMLLLYIVYTKLTIWLNTAPLLPDIVSGLHYKAFLVTVRTSAEEMVEQALQRAHITDSPGHYCIWQVATSNNGEVSAACTMYIHEGD